MISRVSIPLVVVSFMAKDESREMGDAEMTVQAVFDPT